MSIDLSSETLLSLRDAAKSLPGRPHISTIFRWRRVGVRGVRLETCRIGGRRFTSVEALNRFLIAINEPDAKAQTAPRSRPRRRAVKWADRQLEMAGIRRQIGPPGEHD